MSQKGLIPIIWLVVMAAGIWVVGFSIARHQEEATEDTDSYLVANAVSKKPGGTN